MNKTVTDFLMEIPTDKVSYCDWIAETVYWRTEHLSELEDAGLPQEKILEMQVEWKQNLPTLIRKSFPLFNATQIENTIQLIFDCGLSYIYLNDLFNCCTRAIYREEGVPVYTDIFNLFPSGNQLN